MNVTDVALLLMRVVLGATMVAHGVNHWRGGGRIAGTAGWFGGLGLKRPVLHAWLSVCTEIAAGILLILGFFTAFAASAVISVMLVAGVLAHRSNGFFVFRDGYEYVLVLGVMALSLGLLGPGSVSVDHAVAIGLSGWLGGGLALIAGGVATAGLLAGFYRPGEAADSSA